MSSLKTSLYSEHVALKAKLVDFAGWEMPIQYKNLKNEVQTIRNSVGMFDVSHMGEFFIEGPDAIDCVDKLVTNDVKNSKVLKAIYSPLCREDGTIIDDLIVYKISETKVMICVNASNITKDYEWIQEHVENFNCTLKDESENYSLIAVQGPNSFDTLKSISLGFELKNIDYYSLQMEKVEDSYIYIARTGYTGEDGFEIFAPHNYIKNLWRNLLEKNVEPCGLGARDVLRLEVGYPLYGNELNDKVTPYDSGLKWTVKMQKEDFIGKETLANYSPEFTLLKLSLEKGIPRTGYLVENREGQVLGEITSGTMSVTINKGIAIARVSKKMYSPGDNIFVNIRDKKYEAKVNKKPFVNGGHK